VAKNTIICEKMQGIFPEIVKKYEEILTSLPIILRKGCKTQCFMLKQHVQFPCRVEKRTKWNYNWYMKRKIEEQRFQRRFAV
jgi:hypothetical protein